MSNVMSNAPCSVVEVAIKVTSALDRERLAAALCECAMADRSFQFSSDGESGQTIVGGASEQHLDTKVDDLRRIYGIALEVGAPQVAYRETLTKRVETDYTHRKRTGGTGQFARVKIVFEPNEQGAGTSFESKIVGGAMPAAFVAGVETGIATVTVSGVLAGFPLIDVKATLIDGAFHDIDSSAAAFEIAARAAFREALRDGGSILLEPIMNVEITTPEDCLGSVRGDLLGRRGRIGRQEMRGGAVVVEAMVPLANLFGYGNQLRSFSRGRATFTMHFSSYEICPDPPDGKRPPPAAAAALIQPSVAVHLSRTYGNGAPEEIRTPDP